jgi:hypothetical protein
VFSTGPEIPPTVLGGVVTDRLTGQPVAGAAVVALPEADTVPYVAIADQEGFFAIRFLPPGPYVLRGLRDGDGDWRVGAAEPRDERAVEVAAGDTLVEPLALLVPDTTPPSLVRAEFVDSVTVRLDFDDALDPEDPQASLEVRVVGTADGHEPRATAIAPHLVEEAFEAERAALAAEDSAAAAAAAAADSARRAEAQDSTAEGEPLLGAEADSVAPGPAVPAVTRAARPAAPPRIDVPRGPDGLPLPTREWYVRLDGPLAPGATSLAFVTGARNVHGLGEGGGEAEFTAPLPEPPPDEVAPPEGAAPPPPDGEAPPPLGDEPDPGQGAPPPDARGEAAPPPDAEPYAGEGARAEPPRSR